MMSYVEECKNNLFEWERKIAAFLEERLPAEKIEDCLAECRKDVSAFFYSPNNQDIPPSLRQAVAGLMTIRRLLEWAATPLPDDIPAEDAARFAFNSFQAGLSVGMACPGRGMEVFQWQVEKLQQLPKRAADARYAESRKLNKYAAGVAKALWKDGSTLQHHQMKKYLTDEYQDKEGKFPFNLMTDRTLLRILKNVAKEIGRTDLISGLKKII